MFLGDILEYLSFSQTETTHSHQVAAYEEWWHNSLQSLTVDGINT